MRTTYQIINRFLAKRAVKKSHYRVASDTSSYLRKQLVIKDFTLIELLIVISIMAILTSLLLPSLKKARDTSKNIICGGNLKQIGIAEANYMSDSNYMIPTLYKVDSQEFWYANTAYKEYLSIRPSLSGSARKWPNSRMCPFAPRLTLNPAVSDSDPTTSYGRVIKASESSNWVLRGYFKTVRNPSRKYLVGDWGSWHMYSGRTLLTYWNQYSYAEGTTVSAYVDGGGGGYVRLTHFKKANFLFFDMHVNGEQHDKIIQKDASDNFEGFPNND